MTNPSGFSNGSLRGGSDDWGTPRSLYRNLNQEFNFTLDAAANADNALCARYWTVEDDALTQDWSAEPSIWLNPPYSQIPEFLEQAHKAGVTAVLIPFRTAAKWWLKLILMNPHCHEIRHLSRNVRFIPAPGIKQKRLNNRSPMACCVIIFRNVPRQGEIRQTVNCADTGLLIHVINRGSKSGRPTLYDAEILDRVIDLYERKRMVSKVIADQLQIPLRTVQRVVRKLS